MKRWLIVLGIVVVAAGGVAWALRAGSRTKADGQYRTASVMRGDVVATVHATGIVQPLKLVDVGTQVNGPVQKLYVDYNDKVKAGDLVAQIEPTVYEARLAQDKANLKQSKASVEQAQAKLLQADKDLERAIKLAARAMLSDTELDAARANRDTLAAQVKVAEASVAQSKASLRLSQANLGYTTIRSPVDGVVIARNVSEGQTVVANMSAQVLFKIATDLREVQVEASIPEADIGRIRAGQPVSFTVDAYEDTFTGAVTQIRLSAASVQNVVTYPVVIQATNPDGLLYPGMTANISCEVARRTGALKVPNAALRFKPAADAAPPAGRDHAAAERGERGGRGDRPAGPQVWAWDKAERRLTPVAVTPGVSDGSSTEILEPTDLAEGQDVVTGLLNPGEKNAAVVNPFMPRGPGGPGGGGGGRRGSH